MGGGGGVMGVRKLFYRNNELQPKWNRICLIISEIICTSLCEHILCEACSSSRDGDVSVDVE